MTKLIAYGDSIFAGWNGKSQDSSDQRIPELIGKAMGWDVTNTAISGAKFDDRNDGFPNMAKTHSAAGYDYALICFGVNDWCFPSGSVDYPLHKAKEGIETLKGQNPSIKILLELPTEDFRNGSTTLFDFNSQGWTQNQLDDGLISVAKQEGIDYYDWRPDPIITYANANQTLGDGNTGVHPTPETSKEIATRLVAKLKQMMATSKPADQPHHDSGGQSTTPDKPSDGTPMKPAKKELKLAELADEFKVGTNVTSNVNDTVDFINSLYQRVADAYGALEATKITWKISLDNTLFRPLRNGVITSLLALNGYINNLIRYCKKGGIMDYESGEYVKTIELGIPRILTVDEDYQTIINDDWKLIQDTLNQLSLYVQEMEG